MFLNSSQRQGGKKSIQECREDIHDPQKKIAARLVIAKLASGFDMDFYDRDEKPKSKRELLNRRAECRRVCDVIRNQPNLDKLSEADMSRTSHAVSYLASEIDMISIQLDLAEADDEMNGIAGTNHDSTTLRNQDGHKIGTVLSNATLRNPNAIASQLGVHDTADTADAPTLTEFCRGIAGMKSSESVRNALSEGTNTAGGYSVPVILLPGILSALVPPSSLLRAGAQIAVIKDQGKSFNIAAVNSIPTAAWRNEAGVLATSDPAFRALTITPRSLAFQFKISRELLQDSPNLELALRTSIASAFAKEIDRAGLRGSGVAPEITGLLNTPGIQAVANGANGTPLGGYANFISAMQAIKTADAPTPTAAIMHPRSEAKLAGLLDTTGQPLRLPPAVDKWNMLATSQIPTALTVGTSTDCSELYIGAFENLIIFMREGISIQMAIELYAATGEIGFMCHTRVDVGVLYPAAFAVVTGVRP
jgi:HK97 family phage major capsid protein